MKIKKFFHKVFRILIVVTSIGIIPVQSSYALSQAQKNLYTLGINYFDAADTSSCGSTGTGTSNVGSGSVADAALNLTQHQIDNANTIIGIAKTENLGQAGAIVGIMTALDESKLKILANSNVPLSENNPNKQGDGNNYDSLGVFQQRISQGWSTISSDINNQAAINQLMTAAYNAEAFFGSPAGTKAPSALSKGLQNVNGWEKLAPWVAVQRVQVSGDSSGLNYKQFFKPAQAIIAKYYDSAPAVPLPVPFTGAGTGVATSPSDACGSLSGGVVAGDIIKTALGLAWPSGGHGKLQSEATKTYQTTMPKVQGGDPGNDAWSDCGVFVSTVMRSSGADPSYPLRGTDSQEPILAKSPKYKNLGQLSNSAEVQPGDIFIGGGHTFIYVGPQKGGNSVAEASWTDHVPQLDTPLAHYGGSGSVYNNYGAGAFTTFRLINQGG